MPIHVLVPNEDVVGGFVWKKFMEYVLCSTCANAAIKWKFEKGVRFSYHWAFVKMRITNDFYLLWWVFLINFPELAPFWLFECSFLLELYRELVLCCIFDANFLPFRIGYFLIFFSLIFRSFSSIKGSLKQVRKDHSILFNNETIIFHDIVQIAKLFKVLLIFA